MSANVETMFYTREKPWHGLGTRVEEAPTSQDALILAGLDWEVASKPIYDEKGKEIAGYRANTRMSDGSVLGVVGGKYSIVQNTKAFDFTDALVGDGGMKYETAGSLRGGRQIWLLGKMPERNILGDKFEPYICFTNTHDGSGAVKVCMTPIRVVCNNTLNVALREAKRTWSTRHCGDISGRLEEARQTLELADIYLKNLAENAERMADQKMTDGDIEQAIDKIIGLPEDASERQKTSAKKIKEEIMVCMISPDLIKFMNTKWGFVNAISDYVGHGTPLRATQTFAENRWHKIMDGHPMFDKAVETVGVR